jgi:hypothetical protein
MRFVGAIVLTICVNVLFSHSALAEKRVALVIGNSSYQNVAHLTNPANDAQRVADTLKTAGFDPIISLRDVKASDIRRGLRAFADQVREADVVVVYYAGHGIEVDGINYLIPVDAVLERDTDVYDEAFPLDRVLVTIDPARRVRLVILDACRDNPFARTMKRTIATRAVGHGLAKVEPASPNTLIAFAAKAGSTAFDGDDKGSPFTTALVKHIATPGLDLRKAFGYVRDDVLRVTDNRQEPYVYGSLGGDDVPLVPAKPAPAGPQPSPQSEVRRDYELALQAGDREAWQAFLRAYPSGFYADLARVQLKKIATEEASAVAAQKARLAEQEQARLAAERAKEAEQAKAAVEAKAAETARLAAEKAKRIEAEKAAAAERSRAAAEEAAAEKLAAEKAAAEQKAVAEERAAADKAAEVGAVDKGEAGKAPAADAATNPAPKPAATVTPNQATPDKLSALTPEPPHQEGSLSAAETARLVQAELRRVGCFAGDVSDEWTDAARRSLERFNKYSGLKLDAKAASLDILGTVKAKTARVCPPLCNRGYRAMGDTCVKISCKAGYHLTGDNLCEKIESKGQAAKPVAGAEKPRREQALPGDDGASLHAQIDRSALPAGPAPSNLPTSGPRVTGGGHTTCGPFGCQIVPAGCHAVRGAGGHGLGGKIFCP